ncbi:hypothetical protein [Nocardia barduliensis]|uniref:hypothetical protein n=1 Tax=Nocardia barduliensis TaxID=2736643 RepID=UPI0015742E42|nr:hypothetical protein [Nocardia barduliensis]
MAGISASARRRLRRGSPAIDSARPAFAAIPWREKLVTIRRVLSSQTPFHDPAHDALPEFADRWLDRYSRGDDVGHWYTSLAG